MKMCEKCDGETLYLGAGRWFCSKCDHDTVEFILCQNCGKRQGTENWVGDGGMLAFTHGFSQCWCKICCLEEQLKHAREVVARIAGMETELAALKEKE